jgi:succinate-acetate transporter protein
MWVGYRGVFVGAAAIYVVAAVVARLVTQHTTNPPLNLLSESADSPLSRS